MAQDDANHWWSEVGCPHGFTRNGVWLGGTVQDDRNFLDLAPETFANHQRLHVDCDCTLEQDWAPEYVAPAALDEPPPAKKAEKAAPAPRGAGAAAFIVWGVYPVLYGGRVTCPHGWFQSGVRQGPPTWPNLNDVRDQTYQNHQRLFGCGDTLAPSDSTALVTLNGISIRSGVMQPVPEASGVVTGSALMWNGSRLSIAQPGLLYEITAEFALAGTVGRGANGSAVLLIQGNVFARAPLIDVNGHATGRVAWSGILPTGYTLRVGFENNSGGYQDVLAGGTLNASTLTIATPP